MLRSTRFFRKGYSGLGPFQYNYVLYFIKGLIEKEENV